jgi:hypothetical protein
MDLLLRFIQLLCEGHNGAMQVSSLIPFAAFDIPTPFPSYNQDMLREQPQNVHSFNVVLLVLEFVRAVLKMPSFRSTELALLHQVCSSTGILFEDLCALFVLMLGTCHAVGAAAGLGGKPTG